MHTRNGFQTRQKKKKERIQQENKKRIRKYEKYRLLKEIHKKSPIKVLLVIPKTALVKEDTNNKTKNETSQKEGTDKRKEHEILRQKLDFFKKNLKKNKKNCVHFYNWENSPLLMVGCT